MIEQQTLKPIMDFTQKGLKKPEKELSDEEILREFGDYGKTETQILADITGNIITDRNGNTFIPTDDNEKGEKNEN